MRALLAAAEIEGAAITDVVAESARSAFERHGEGRHGAQLDLDDGFAYSMARLHDVPLPLTCDDFGRTDLRPEVTLG